MGDRATTPLQRAQTASAARCGQDGRDRFQPFQAHDLFNQLDRHRDIGAPRRRCDLQLVAVTRNLAADLLQAANDGLTRVVHTDQIGRPRCAHADGFALTRFPDEGPARCDGATCDLHQQRGGNIERDLHQLRVHTTLEAP